MSTNVACSPHRANEVAQQRWRCRGRCRSARSRGRPARSALEDRRQRRPDPDENAAPRRRLRVPRAPPRAPSRFGLRVAGVDVAVRIRAVGVALEGGREVDRRRHRAGRRIDVVHRRARRSSRSGGCSGSSSRPPGARERVYAGSRISLADAAAIPIAVRRTPRCERRRLNGSKRKVATREHHPSWPSRKTAVVAAPKPRTAPRRPGTLAPFGVRIPADKERGRSRSATARSGSPTSTSRSGRRSASPSATCCSTTPTSRTCCCRTSPTARW